MGPQGQTEKDTMKIKSVKKKLPATKVEILTFISTTRFFKPFEFGNGSRISDKNLVILEFKYLQNKKW